MAGQRVLIQHLIVEVAEPAAEGDMLLRRQMLITDRDHAIVEMRLVDIPERVVAQVIDVDAKYLRSKRIG